MNRGNKNDRRLLKPRVLANHFRQLKAIQLRHADIHQDDRDVRLEKHFERFAPRRGFQ
jgi:hypothetical protein